MLKTEKKLLDLLQQENVVSIAKALLGKTLVYYKNDKIYKGMIVETEAYKAPHDKGSHAYKMKRTKRNESMYLSGGHIYMYLCYGIHTMFNLVTGPEKLPHAILIRALEPLSGLPAMRDNRAIFHNDKQLCKGPGALSQAFNLDMSLDGMMLKENFLTIHRGKKISKDQIQASARIGFSIQGRYRTIPWRFFIRKNPYVSAKLFTKKR